MENNRLKKQKPFERGFGILLPIFSLPSQYGIGNLGKEAFQFIDFLNRSGASYWQILPIGPTGYGDSPYQSFSSFAGNPYFIDPVMLFEKNLITDTDLEEAKTQPGEIDYENLYKTRFKLLKKAFENSNHKNEPEYIRFINENSYWINDYANYTALKSGFNDISRKDFPKYRTKDKEAECYAEISLAKEIDFCKFIQYEFDIQWNSVKQYATEKGIKIIGDLPLYTSDDSADVWADPKVFSLDEESKPKLRAGVPPDKFSADGQLWGNPVYNWQHNEETDFDWWIRRVKRQFELFDILRIDHFIGISRYYTINREETTARNGKWHDGPDKKLILALQNNIPQAKYIAEDLGMLNSRTKKLLKLSGFPGMKLMEQAFDSGCKNPNLTHNIEKNTCLYTGTHDNETLCGSINSLKRNDLSFAKKYLGIKRSSELQNAIIRECFKSSANTVIIPLQDFLFLDNSARINTPGTLGGNWKWQLQKLPPNTIADDILSLGILYDRSKYK